MKTLLVCVSVSHGNTRKVAEAIAGVLDATVAEPEDVDPADIAGYDLVGFGSGVYFMALHPRLRELVEELPSAPRNKAFLFATSGSRELPFVGFFGPLKAALARKGFDVVGTFSCRGYDTWLPLLLIGGINKGRPNDADLDAARSFANGLRAGLEASAARHSDEPAAGAT